MSFVISVFNVGIVDNIVAIWLKSWSFAFIVAFPAVLMVAPLVRKIVVILIKTDD
jgi:hypothetical protein